MDVTGIIILNYNTFKESVECITSIRNNTSIPYKIYLVDNNSPNGSGEELFDYYKNDSDVAVLLNKENGGYSAGNNIGIKRAIKDGCEVVYIVNSDVEILNDAFKIMNNTLLSDDEYMMIGPSVMNILGNESQLPRRKYDFKTFVLESYPLCFTSYAKKHTDRRYKLTNNIFQFKGSTSGCCWGMRSKDLKQIDYLDENVFLYSEEDILAYKMEYLDKLAVVDINAKILHKENISTKKEGMPFIVFYSWISKFYLLKRYGKVNKAKQLFIYNVNCATWTFLSLIKKKYRSKRKQFIEKNKEILKKDYE